MARRTVLSAALVALAIAAGCGSHEQATEEQSVIPQQQEQQPPVSIETRTDTVAAIHAPAQEPPSRPATTAGAQRFKVQIGAFRDPQHASLVQNLARERFALPASNEYDTGTGTYRIRIGSFETRKDAEDFRRKIQQEFPGEYGDAWIIVPGESQ